MSRPNPPDESPDGASLLPGRATTIGTRRFADRQNCESDHFACPDELWLSSIALGTLRGSPGGIDDLLYRSVVGDFLEWSGNVFNTALSDRLQTSERALGQALARALREGAASRDEIVVMTKGGALTPNPAFANDPMRAQSDLVACYLDSGILDPSEITRGHSMAPRFLLDQIKRSRLNLKLETIDYYLIQEPEIHLRELGADGFQSALAKAFEAMEYAVGEGWIGAYGLSTWDGFLLPDSDRSHLSIVDLFRIALDVGSADHHLRVLQLPFGLAMGEGAVAESQLGPDGHSHAILDSLSGTGTVVMASAPLYAGRLIGHVPAFVREAFPEAPSDATTALQFVRSTPNVTTAVVGMREVAHVEDNMRLRSIPRADRDLPLRLFAQANRQSSATL
jgi:aryl-alcohol dehydrogenase-like predicted oxidoreductase